jgi:RNA polymerase sigma factor (sigma-70 family)
VNLGYDDFAALYRDQATALLVFFERRVDEPELATDLLAETFARALRERTAFAGKRFDDVVHWLWDIGRAILGEHQARVERGDADAAVLGRERRRLTAAEVRSIEELADRAALRAAVQSNLAGLSADQYEALRLRIVEDLSYEEIAARLGQRPEDVRTRVWRALRRLAERAQDHREQEDR